MNFVATRPQSSVAQPSGFGENWETSSTNATTSTRVTSETSDKALGAPGATGVQNTTLGTSGTWVTQSLVLNPVTTVTRYAFSDSDDSPEASIDTNGAVTDKTTTLIGGATRTTHYVGTTGTATWEYPNIHGDVAAQTDNAGTKQGPTRIYDPFGQALTELVNDMKGNADFGYLGNKFRMTEHEGILDTIEMGARQYVPGLGRFLEVDPVEGGSANDYDYVDGDPVNAVDLNGEANFFKKHWKAIAITVAVVAVVVTVGIVAAAVVAAAETAEAAMIVAEANAAFESGAAGGVYRGGAKVSARVAAKAGRRWVDNGTYIRHEKARNGADMMSRGIRKHKVSYRGPAKKGRHGRSANLNVSLKGRHDYFNFHINVH